MRSTWLFVAHGLEIENAVHLDAESSLYTTPNHSPHNPNTVCHHSETVRQQYQNSSTLALKAVHWQRQKQLLAALVAAICSQQSATKFPSEP